MEEESKSIPSIELLDENSAADVVPMNFNPSSTHQNQERSAAELQLIRPSEESSADLGAIF